MKLRVALASLALVSANISGSHTAEAQMASLGARIDSIAHAALDDGQIAGLSVAVVQRGQIIHAGGYGWADVEKGVPASSETVYVIASVTKLLTAAAVMKLVDADRLSLEDNLASLLPEFPNAEQARRITLRQLLNHTSGLNEMLPATVAYRDQTQKPVSFDFALEYVEGRGLDFDPGTHWSYSNTGFYLIGAIIERVSGQSYGSYVRDSVARPLGLLDTFLCDDDLNPTRRTVGYAPSDSGFVRNSDYEVAGERTGYGAAGGLCSTALDLARLPGGLTRQNVLSRAALSDMLAPTILSDSSRVDYGLGVRRGRLEGHPVWGHTGGSGSTWAIVAHYPDRDVTIAVLVNTDRSTDDAWVLEGRIARSVLDVPPARLVERPVTEEALSVYVGRYRGGRYGRQYAVTLGDAGLQVALLQADARPTELVNVAEHTFSLRTAPMDHVVFDVEDGRVRGYSLYLDGIFSGFRKRADY